MKDEKPEVPSAEQLWDEWFERDIEYITKVTAEDNPKAVYIRFADYVAAQAVEAATRQAEELHGEATERIGELAERVGSLTEENERLKDEIAQSCGYDEGDPETGQIEGLD